MATDKLPNTQKPHLIQDVLEYKDWESICVCIWKEASYAIALFLYSSLAPAFDIIEVKILIKWPIGLPPWLLLLHLKWRRRSSSFIQESCSIFSFF